MTRSVSGEAQRNQAKLQRAVREGDVSEVERCLKTGASPEGNSGFPLLHKAIKDGHLEIVQLLVQAGADIERTSHDGWTPLTRADADDQFDICTYLLSIGADESSRHRHGFSPLHKAARKGDSERCSLLLRGGADVDARASDGATPLALASMLCDVDASAEVIRTLLHHRAALDLTDNDGWSAISHAAYEDTVHAKFDEANVVRVPLLLNAGANPDLGCFPPLLAAITQEGHSWRVIDLLLRAGANPDCTDDEGENLLHRAASYTADSEFIVRCGSTVSDVDHTDNLGDRAIDSILDESRDPTDIDEAAVLLALVALGADLTSVADRLPGWLDVNGHIIRAHIDFDVDAKLKELERITSETRVLFGKSPFNRD